MSYVYTKEYLQSLKGDYNFENRMSIIKRYISQIEKNLIRQAIDGYTIYTHIIHTTAFDYELFYYQILDELIYKFPDCSITLEKVKTDKYSIIELCATIKWS